MKPVKPKRENILYLLLFLLCIIKYMLFGFSYFPILDDYIQYDGYRMYNDLNYVYFGIGTVSTRPLASILDPVFWGAIPKGVALFIITLLHYFSCVFFYKSAKKLDAQLSPVFGIIYLMIPVMAESTYWLSASTRVVCGLFFASLSIYFLSVYIKKAKKMYIAVFWVLSFLSCGFYEAALLFSSACILLLMIYFRREIKNKWIFIIPFANGAAFCGIYMSLSGVGAMGSRAQDFKITQIFTAQKILEFFKQFKEVISKGFWELTNTSFFGGVENLLNGNAYGAFIFICIAFIACAFFYKTQRGEGKKLSAMIFAFIMFFVPLLVNFLPSEMWLTFRSFGFSVFALALFLDRLICLAKGRFTVGAVSCVLAFLFTVGSVGEYSLYKEVSERDFKACQSIVNVLEKDVLSGEKEAVVVLEKIPSAHYLFYKDHIKSVFFEDWSLTGAVRSVAKNIKIKKITPIKAGADFNKEDKQIIYIDENFDVKGENYIG